MPWLKVSDTAALHPVVTGPLAEEVSPDDQLDQADLVNLAFGLVLRCATHSAGYTTDYVVSDGTVAMMGGPHWRQRAELAARAGYWIRVEIDGKPGWKIMEDSTNFVHIRLKAELDWERQRRRDVADDSLVIPVRLRDGDGCRYCAVIVNWTARRGGRRGTYDHRIPGQAARGPDDLVVACNSCNSARSNRPDAEEQRPLRPAPADPFYGSETVAMLARHGYDVPPSIERPGRQPDHATPRPTPAASRPATPPATPPTGGAGHQPDTRDHRERAASSARPTTPPRPDRRRAPKDPRTGPRPDGDPNTSGVRGSSRRRQAGSTTPRDPRTGPRPDGDPNTSGVRGSPRRQAAGGSTTARPAPTADTARAPRPQPPARAAPNHQDQQLRAGSADPADRRHAGFEYPGRDGTGNPTPTPTDLASRKRGRRGRPPRPGRPQPGQPRPQKG